MVYGRFHLAIYSHFWRQVSLLARLAVAKMQDINWSDTQSISRLHIADFACGIGALLAAVYDQIASHHERTGGNAEKLHSLMIEQVLYGFDVMPYAALLSASALSEKQPQIAYTKAWLHSMPYGRQEDNTVQIGSLEFLDEPEQRVLLHTSAPAKRIGSSGEEAADLLKANVPDQSLDMVIMTPSFTCPTNHEKACTPTSSTSSLPPLKPSKKAWMKWARGCEI